MLRELFGHTKKEGQRPRQAEQDPVLELILRSGVFGSRRRFDYVPSAEGRRYFPRRQRAAEAAGIVVTEEVLSEYVNRANQDPDS